MHIRSNTWRLSILTALGVWPWGCGGKSTGAACGESVPVMADGKPTGLEKCAISGVVHRVSYFEPVCQSELPRSAELVSPLFCSSDADCTERPHGHCEYGCPSGTWCQYGCVSNADCEPGYQCVCGSPVGTCQPSDCRDDKDCGNGSLCVARGGGSFRCQRPEDECAADADCPKDEFGASRQCSGFSEPLTCQVIPTCGRPFLVGGVARVASATAEAFGNSVDTLRDLTAGRGAGTSPVFELYARPGIDAKRLDVEALDKGTRTSIAGYWTEVALMEHASIAAFARFALQLMHLGAPLDLLEACQGAMHDETEHARACFAIATRMLGRPVGPGKLALDGALAETSLVDIVRLTIREGCVGETMAAIEAAEAASVCEEPFIRATLVQIQADELRHAELAWRFVQWALAQTTRAPERAALEAVVRAEFAAVLAELGEAAAPAPFCAPDEIVGERYGVLSAATRLRVRRLALREVIAPCVEPLLASVSPCLKASDGWLGAPRRQETDAERSIFPRGSDVAETR